MSPALQADSLPAEPQGKPTHPGREEKFCGYPAPTQQRAGVPPSHLQQIGKVKKFDKCVPSELTENKKIVLKHRLLLFYETMYHFSIRLWCATKSGFYAWLAQWLGFPDSSVGKKSACNAGDPGLIPALRRFTGEGIGYTLQYPWVSLVAQLVMNLPAMWETWVRSQGWEDLLEKGKATHSSILAWRIPWTVESVGSQRVGHTVSHSISPSTWPSIICQRTEMKMLAAFRWLIHVL